eukprot:5871919-Pleurochrysis_carterae.AAC.8
MPSFQHWVCLQQNPKQAEHALKVTRTERSQLQRVSACEDNAPADVSMNGAGPTTIMGLKVLRQYYDMAWQALVL